MFWLNEQTWEEKVGDKGRKAWNCKGCEGEEGG